jgi:hypothetical protein
MFQRHCELLDLLLEDPRHVGMQGRRRGLSFARGNHSLEFVASLLDLLKLPFPRLVAEPVQQQFENLLRPSVDGSQLARRICLLGLALRTQLVPLGNVQPRPFIKTPSCSGAAACPVAERVARRILCDLATALSARSAK